MEGETDRQTDRQRLRERERELCGKQHTSRRAHILHICGHEKNVITSFLKKKMKNEKNSTQMLFEYIALALHWHISTHHSQG